MGQEKYCIFCNNKMSYTFYNEFESEYCCGNYKCYRNSIIYNGDLLQRKYYVAYFCDKTYNIVCNHINNTTYIYCKDLQKPINIEVCYDFNESKDIESFLKLMVFA